jgi:hypothetical protein
MKAGRYHEAAGNNGGYPKESVERQQGYAHNQNRPDTEDDRIHHAINQRCNPKPRQLSVLIATALVRNAPGRGRTFSYFVSQELIETLMPYRIVGHVGFG